MEKIYKPQESEKTIYQYWSNNGFFKPLLDNKAKSFTVTIPPPNVTGVLHMGHALNNTIQDVLIRWHRMRGFNTLWLPGTDHAGIATQNKVEQKLATEGKSRFDVGRDNFHREVWEWKEQYENRILDQLKNLGCSCDWDRLRFTMDYDYSVAVIETFAHYYQKGCLYRGTRIINWCPRCSTSISDLEVEHEEISGKLWYIKYPLSDGDDITVATTRPETMLGDTAIAVNPNDKRYKNLVGRTAIIPVINRKIPIIADEAIDSKFGTGAVKVTPAHDPTDYEIGERHGLDKLSIINEEAKITYFGEQFSGMDRFEAREALLEILEDGKWLVKEEPYSHSIGHCSRCHTVIEPLLSQQWFIKMKDLAKPAIKVVRDSQIKFHPVKWEKVYLKWMENIKDWCVSRQLWWGHRLPVWYCDCGETIISKEWAIEDLEGSAKEKTINHTPTRVCPNCSSTKLRRDDDVLDTWFSSALWPFASLGWPKESDDLKYFYPTDFLSTARDILFLWVSRMIFSGLEFTKNIPFKDVYIHPTVFNLEGKRMSKSLGTGVDPVVLIEKYGADALRFGLLWQMAQGQDMKFGEDAILNGQRFANKIWNASRFVMMNLEDYQDVSRETIATSLLKEDLEILKKADKTILSIDKYLAKYDFQHAVELIYDFFWHDYCDQYLETAKKRIKEEEMSKMAAQFTLKSILGTSLKALHPFMPFVSEKIWQELGQEKALIISNWPSNTTS